MATKSLLLPLALSLTVLLISVPTSVATDPDPLQDFCVADLSSPVVVNGFPCKPNTTVVSADFSSAALYGQNNTYDLFGSSVREADVLTFPGLNTLGLSMIRVDFAPGGIHPLHVHPRASELVYIIDGEVQVGFVSSVGVFYSRVLVQGMNFIIPRGLLHFELNVGKGTAQEISAFNSQLPGEEIVSEALFGSKPPIPDNVLSKTFLVDNQVIDLIKSKFGN